ncbi:MAG: CocE/NonD family hydrolase [Pedobacter sp.]
MFWFYLLSSSTSAQQLFFPATNYADSAVLSNQMPGLARQVIGRYQESNKLVYFDNLFRFQLVAGEFTQAETSLRSLIKLVGAEEGDTVSTQAIGFAFQTYLANKIKNNDRNGNAASYTKTFERLYNALNIHAQDFVPGYFTNDNSAVRSQLQSLINTAGKTDSISLTNAIALCRTYCAIKVYGETQSTAQQLLAKIENDKYFYEDSVLVKMPDGGTISLAVYRDKKITVPQPVVLLYNIYAGDEASDCKLAVKNGYIGIVANPRGKRLSPDAFEPFEHDGKDAYAIIDWIIKQPWSNGKVGMYGGSYLGFAQWAATKNLHPALKTIVPQAAAAPGVDFPVMNGIIPTYLLRYLHFVMDNKLADYAGFANVKKWETLAGTWYQKGTSFRSLDTLEGRPNSVFQRYLNHPAYDSFWQNMIPQREEFSKINIPILTTTGYYDDDQLGAMYYYKQYHEWNKNPNDYLLIGPFDHGGSQYKASKVLGGYAIDPVAQISIIEIVFKWFDHVLKGGDLPSILKDRVNFEVMGANEWRHVPSLAQMHNDSLILYLGNTVHEKIYPLKSSKPTKKGFISQQVDFRERTDIRFRGENIIAFTKLTDSTLKPEKEKLVFISDPVDGTFAISGALKANINLMINKMDVDLVLDLYEQTPDGQYFALNESLQRASYANDRTKRQLLRPGKVTTVKLIHNFITSRKLQKGSRIVLTVGMNKSPNWQVNYGTGKDVSKETIADGKIPLDIKWFNSSYVTIPILR